MLVTQISVFVENKKGRLEEITRLLKDRKINIRAICIADTTKFGILRMIVDKPQETSTFVKEEGFTVKKTEVLAIDVPDHPGGLNRVLEILENEDISIEYLYSFILRPCNDPLMIFRVDQSEKAVQVLQEGNIKVIPQKEIQTEC